MLKFNVFSYDQKLVNLKNNKLIVDSKQSQYLHAVMLIDKITLHLCFKLLYNAIFR